MEIAEFLNEWNDGNPCLTVHTSGSTGKPKPISVQKERMLASAHLTCDFLGLRPGQNALLCLPLDYIAGKMMVVRSIERDLNLFATHPNGHPLSNLDFSRHIHFAAMVPLQVANSLKVKAERERLMQIDHIIIGGGAIDNDLAEQLKLMPNAIWSTYGMTETLSHIALRRLSGPNASKWYTPFDGVKIALDSRGCLTIVAPAVCDSKLVTNDCATLHSDGRKFIINGRIDNVINSGGIKVQIEEVEQLLSHYLNKPFAITRKPDALLGETIVLLTTDSDTDSVAAICNQVIANKYHRPRLVAHIEAIPLTETGKIARNKTAAIAQKL